MDACGMKNLTPVIRGTKIFVKINLFSQPFLSYARFLSDWILHHNLKCFVVSTYYYIQLSDQVRIAYVNIFLVPAQKLYNY